MLARRPQGRGTPLRMPRLDGARTLRHLPLEPPDLPEGVEQFDRCLAYLVESGFFRGQA
jgi:hypothetical protein